MVEQPPRRATWGRRLFRAALRAVLRVYMRVYHRLEMHGREYLPPHGPALVMLNHASLLDVPAMMVLDPYPDTGSVVKASLVKVPLVSWALAQWDAIPVERQGHDSSGVRALLGVLRSGRVLAVAAEGRRTRRGHLEAINPVLARIAASANVPIIPVGISGSFEALPPGALWPRPKKIVVRVGEPFRLPPRADGAAAAQVIRARIAALLPASMQPLDEAPLG